MLTSLKSTVPVFIEDDVLEHGAKTQRLEMSGSDFRRQVDGLGVAAAFDVEDAVVAPAMFVIADQLDA